MQLIPLTSSAEQTASRQRPKWPGAVLAAMILMILGALMSLVWLLATAPVSYGVLAPGLNEKNDTFDWLPSFLVISVVPSVLPCVLWILLAVMTALAKKWVRIVSICLAGLNLIASTILVIGIALMIAISYAPKDVNRFAQPDLLLAMALPIIYVLISGAATILLWTPSAKRYSGSVSAPPLARTLPPVGWPSTPGISR